MIECINDHVQWVLDCLSRLEFNLQAESGCDMTAVNIFTQLMSLKKESVLTSQEVKDLAACLNSTSLSSVTGLHLESNNLAASGTHTLAPHIGQLSSLRTLRVSHNKLVDEGGKSLLSHVANLNR